MARPKSDTAAYTGKRVPFTGELSPRVVAKRKWLEEAGIATNAGRRPRPEDHIPTDLLRDKVALAMAMGMNREDIAVLMRISIRVLQKHYAPELKEGGVHKTLAVAENLFNIATNPDHKGAVSAAIFWMKTRAGWRDVAQVEHTGPGGGAIQVEARTINSRLLTAEQRDTLRDILRTAIAGQTQAAAMERLEHYDGDDGLDGHDDGAEDEDVGGE